MDHLRKAGKEKQVPPSEIGGILTNKEEGL
jgi:hypothetical protein